MNRKSRMIMIGIILCVVIGGGFLWLHGGIGGDEPGTDMIPEELLAASLPAVVPDPNVFGSGANQSAVTISCKIPESSEKVELVSWEFTDVADEEYLEKLLWDNPEKKQYTLKARGSNDFHHSKKYPYFFLIYENRAGFYLEKNTEDGIAQSQEFSKKEVLEKVSQVLEHLSLEVEPVEQWQVEKNANYSFSDRISCEKNYKVSMYPAYRGIPLLYTRGHGYKLAEQYYLEILPWEFQYGDIGWMSIWLDECMKLTGTGQYVDVISLEEAAEYLARKEGYNIAEAKFGYWFSDNHMLRPFWYVNNGAESNAYFRLIDAETGDLYKPNVHMRTEGDDDIIKY